MSTAITDDITTSSVPGLPAVVSENPSFNASINNFVTALQAFIDQLDNLLIKPDLLNLSDDVLNELAVEFRPPGYDQALPKWQRQKMIQEACSDNAHLGTTASVQKLVNQLFGAGVVQEWWQYGGKPYHFRITLPQPVIDPNQVAILDAAILATKPLSRWPDSIGRIGGTASGSQIYVAAAFFRVGYTKLPSVTV